MSLRSDTQKQMKTATITVNISTLKDFAIEKLPKDSPLKHALIVEDDEIPASELPSKVKIWLKLLQLYPRRD